VLVRRVIHQNAARFQGRHVPDKVLSLHEPPVVSIRKVNAQSREGGPIPRSPTRATPKKGRKPANFTFQCELDLAFRIGKCGAILCREQGRQYRKSHPMPPAKPGVVSN
jgi:hypothetical protein